MNKMKSKIYFFFSLIGTLLLSACGVRNHHGFAGDDPRFANYTFLDNDSAGLAYYADSTNPNDIAVGIGTCTAQDIVVTEYDNKPVTSVFPAGFQNCSTIRTITLPDTVTTFGTDAFAGSSLVSITIPNGLTAISSGSFRNCRELTTVRFKTQNQITSIGDYAFANDYKLSSFLFHKIKNLTSIGREAFLYCLGLNNVIFPDDFSVLGPYAFQDCKNLRTIYFPGSITAIGSYAFKGVGESAKIYFSESMQKTVEDCNINDPSVPASFANEHNFSYGEYHIPVAFDVGPLKIEGPFRFSAPPSGSYPLNIYNRTASGNTFIWTDSGDLEYPETIDPENEVVLMNYDDEDESFDPTHLDIPSTIYDGSYKVVGIASDVFQGQTGIQDVTFHENLRFIDAGAFANCTNITKINLEGAVDLQHIQSHAFYNTLLHKGSYDVNHMYSIHIPSNVVNIDPDAFRGCTGLFKVYFDGATDEYEETFICNGTTSSFNLAYTPRGALQSVKVEGPKTTAYTVSGKTVTLNTTPAAKTVVKIKYSIDNTTTQTFKGYMTEDQNGVSALAKDFILSSQVTEIASVKVGDTVISPDTGYTLTTVLIDPTDPKTAKTKISFTSAPGEDATIVIKYKAPSKLEKIGEYAFYGCSDNIGDKDYSKLKLRSYNDPYQEVHFPASLETIEQYAFANSQIVGNAIFKSASLSIWNHAFYSVDSLSGITFPENMTSLTLRERCFASDKGVTDYVAGTLYKKLFSVILPRTTTLAGNNIFYGHIFITIYCIGNLPAKTGSYGSWNTLGSNIITSFGDFSGSGNKTEMDKAPVYTISGKSDVVSLPSEEYPIFDFVKQTANQVDYATLTNYHYYGGRIKDQDGHPAIVSGKNLNDYSSGSINGAYSSQYAVMLTTNGHFRFEIPSQVKFGNAFVPVKKVGKSSLSIQINESDMHPKSGAGEKPEQRLVTDSNSYFYWQPESNYWTMWEINLPNSIDSIGDASMAVIPFKTLRSYDQSQTSVLSDDGKAYIHDDSKAISAIGQFPASLTTIGKKAFVFSGITHAKLPSTLIEFGGITGTSNPDESLSYVNFPFMGCFNLQEISMETESAVFATYDNGVLIYNKNGNSKGVMIEGAEGKSTLNIPWATTRTFVGAIRGGRNITQIHFPYTLDAIPQSFLDMIGSSRDSDGRSCRSALTDVTFEKGSYYGASADDRETYKTPSCTSIGRSAFYGCNLLTNVEFPVGLQSIGIYAFRYCDSLSNMSVDRGVKDDDPFTDTSYINTPLGDHLDCTKLPSLTSIGESAFEGCISLGGFTTSSNMPSVGKTAFKGCTGLTTVTIDSNTSLIGESCFNGCTGLNNVTFNGPITLNGSAFSGCNNLITATFNDTSNIGGSAFSGCKKLENLTFDEPATIGANAFSDCDGLKIVEIPGGSTLGAKAFEKCDGFANAGGKGIILGKQITFGGDKDTSPFNSCKTGTKIFLLDNELEYQDGRNNNVYPDGWNFRSYSNNKGDPLDFYCYSESNPGTSTQEWGYWHFDDNHQPVIWGAQS